jgi:23S rRNA pseudouridine2605 synthase
VQIKNQPILMPKRNTSGASRPRRGSDSNSNSAGKGFSKKSEDSTNKRPRPRSGKPFRNSPSQDSRPFQQSSADDTAKSRGTKGTGERSWEGSANRNFEKRERGQKPAFNKDERRPARGEGKKDFSSERNGDRPKGNFDKSARPHPPKRASSFSGGSKEERPYKKFDKPGFSKRGTSFSKDEKPRSNKGDSYSSGAERPKKRFDKGNGPRPFFKTREESTDRSFSKDERTTRDPQSGFSKSGPARSGNSERRPRKEGFVTKEKNYPAQNVGAPKGDENRSEQSGKIRLNKFIANSGVCSRREADELIKMGLISVNGQTITELGYKVNRGDEVRHESKVLRAEKPVYILLNKPKGFITTTVDPQERRTVMQLVGNVVKERVYPVGRLDRNTTGLLLLTNDGELAERLMHPSYKVKKIYKVELDRPLTKADAQRIMDGVKLEEGRAMVDDLAIVSDDRKTIGIEIHIGWNRVVRRIFETLEYAVVKLDRTVYAGLNKKDLGRGEWRFLKKEELVLLKHFES